MTTLIVDQDGNNGAYTTIQSAIDAAVEGDTILIGAGTYNENLTVDVNNLTIVGQPGAILEGSFRTDNSLQRGDSVADLLKTSTVNFVTGSGTGITVAADNVTIQALTIQSFQTGINLGNGVDNVRIEDVVVDGTVNGVRKGAAAAVNGFEFVGGEIRDSYIGMYISKETADGQDLNDVLIQGTAFTDLVEKGLYFETLSNALIEDITMENVGQWGRGSAQVFHGGATQNIGGFGGGIDINLKWDHETSSDTTNDDAPYSGITIRDFELTDVGSSNQDGLAAPHFGGAAISVKARDDGSYAGPESASFTGAVVIEDGVINGTSVGIRMGEPSKANRALNTTGPDVDVSNVTVTNAITAGIDNASKSTMTVEMDSADTTLVAQNTATSTGDIEVSGTAGADSVTTAGGNDTIAGGGGNDTINGGGGTDTASYTASISGSMLSTNGSGGWTVAAGGIEGTDTLANVEIVNGAEDGQILLVGNGGFATIQAAINAAGNGDTIVIASGTYTEALSIAGKAITLQEAAGAEVILQAPGSSNAITLSGDFAGGDVTIVGLEIRGAAATPNQGMGVNVMANVNVGTLTLDGVTIRDAGAYGVFVNGGNTASAAAEVVITDSTFLNNGYNGASGSAHIKLFGFDGNATIQNVTITGAPDGTLPTLRPEYGIELTGTPNPAGPSSAEMGVVAINDVTITGLLEKNAFAVWNYADVGGLTISDLDLSDAVTHWGPVLNFDGILGDIDASEFGVLLPTDTAIQTELQGDKPTQSAADNEITGTTSNDRLNGKDGNDALDGGAGNDELIGGAGNDVLDGGTGVNTASYAAATDAVQVTLQNAGVQQDTGGAGIDTLSNIQNLAGSAFDDTLTGDGNANVLSGGTGDDTITSGGDNDTIDGGAGVDTAVYTGDVAVATNASGGWTVNGGATQGIDTVTSVEIVQDSAGRTLLVGNGGFATIQEAIDAAGEGDTILIAAGTYAGNITIDKDGLTLIGQGEVNIVGTFKSDNGIAPDGSVAEFLETAANYDGTSGAGISVNANGVTLSKLNFESFRDGVLITGDINDLRLTDVDVAGVILGLATDAGYSTEGGVPRNVDGLTVIGGSFSDAHIGIDAEKIPAAEIGVGDVTNLVIDGTSFSDITAKGIYFEGLAHALITGIIMEHVGYFGGEPVYGPFAGAGIELNLKKGEFSDVVITDFTMIDVGQSTRFGAPHDNAAAISVKARDDSGAYSPVSFDGVLIISDGTIDGTSTGIRAGEAGKTVAGPAINVTGVVITDAVHDPQNGDVENLTTSPMTVTLTEGSDTLVASPQSTGVITFNALGGSDTVSGAGGDEVINGGAGTDTLTGLGGDDTLNGGPGNDTLFGGAGDDVLNGGGGADVFDGGAGDDLLIVSDMTFELADGGGDIDTLALDGTGLLLGLGDPLKAAKLEGVERIHLGGNGNTLAIDQLAVLGGIGEVTGSTHVLTVEGTAGNTVVFGEEEWTVAGSITDADGTFDRYVLGDAEVRVEQGATVLFDTTADTDRNLALGIPATLISAAERVAVAFAVSGIDADVTNATVTFTDTAGHSVTVSASLGVADLRTLVTGSVTSTLTVVDAAGNTESANGPVIDLDGNVIMGTAGDDVLTADDGDDVLVGGAGADTIIFGTGHSVLQDSLADLNGDSISGLGFTNTIDVQGALIGRSNLDVTIDGNTATISVGGSSFQVTGDFSGGEFMTVARGSGADAHTTVSFVNYLPTLSEGAQVDLASINGIVNQPLLTGDGSVEFILEFKSGTSAYDNALGVYKVAADGTIHDVHILFANTLDVAPGTTINLGVAADDESFGFFLIQDGFDFYGNLPDNLSFVMPNTTTAADLDAGTPAVLYSATRGELAATPIFHSFATLNPGDAIQVLSGTVAGGRELRIGFEDLPTATGDRDFQDVVVAVRPTHDDFLIT